MCVCVCTCVYMYVMEKVISVHSVEIVVAVALVVYRSAGALVVVHV